MSYVGTYRKRPQSKVKKDCQDSLQVDKTADALEIGSGMSSYVNSDDSDGSSGWGNHSDLEREPSSSPENWRGFPRSRTSHDDEDDDGSGPGNDSDFWVKIAERGRMDIDEDSSESMDDDSEEELEGFGALLRVIGQSANAEDMDSSQRFELIEKTYNDLKECVLSLKTQVEEVKKILRNQNMEVYKARYAKELKSRGLSVLRSSNLSRTDTDLERAIIETTRQFKYVKEKLEKYKKGPGKDAVSKPVGDSGKKKVKKAKRSWGGFDDEESEEEEYFDNDFYSCMREKNFKTKMSALKEAMERKDENETKRISGSLKKIFETLNKLIPIVECELESSRMEVQSNKVRNISLVRQLEDSNYKHVAGNLLASVYLHYLMDRPYDGLNFHHSAKKLAKTFLKMNKELQRKELEVTK